MRLSALNMMWRDALPHILAERDDLQSVWVMGPAAWHAACEEDEDVPFDEYYGEYGEYGEWDDDSTPDPSAAHWDRMDAAGFVPPGFYDADRF